MDISTENAPEWAKSVKVVAWWAETDDVCEDLDEVAFSGTFSLDDDHIAHLPSWKAAPGWAKVMVLRVFWVREGRLFLRREEVAQTMYLRRPREPVVLPEEDEKFLGDMEKYLLSSNSVPVSQAGLSALDFQRLLDLARKPKGSIDA